MGEKETHENECIPENTSTNSRNSSSELTVRDIFAMNEDSEIPRVLEDATLHIIKTKMAKSNLPNNSIEFKTGGPRVRTLQCIKKDFQRFQQNGCDIKDAKFYNNVIDENLFDVPINQVSLLVSILQDVIPVAIMH